MQDERHYDCGCEFTGDPFCPEHELPLVCTLDEPHIVDVGTGEIILAKNLPD